MINQQIGERNFHSFYSLIYGASEAELKELGLKASDLKKYSYLSQGGVADSAIAAADDRKSYGLVNEAMKVCNFEAKLAKSIWNLVAAIVHLGNIKFESEDKDSNNNMSNSDTKKFAAPTTLEDRKTVEQGSAKISGESSEKLLKVAKLLCVDEKELGSALTSRLLATGHKELVTKLLSASEGLYAKDALAKVQLIF